METGTKSFVSASVCSSEGVLSISDFSEMFGTDKHTVERDYKIYSK